MKNSTQVSELVRYPLVGLTLSGCLFVVKNCKGTWQKVQCSKIRRTYVVCVFILALVAHVSCIGRTVAFGIYFVSNFNNVISFFVQAYLYCLYGTIVYICESLTCHWYLGTVMESLQDYGNQFGFCKELLSLKKIVLMLLAFLVFGAVASTIIANVFTIGDGDYHLIFPLDISSMTLVCLTVLSYMVVVTPIVLLFTLYFALTEIVVREFYDTGNEMKRVIKQVTEMKLMEQEFVQLRSRHESLCQIVNKLSKLIRLKACVGLIFSMVITFFALYALGSEELSRIYIALEITFLVWTIVPIVIICILWGRLPPAAHSVIDAISMVSCTGVSQDLLLQMQLFVSICSSRRVGIDVFGLFTLESTTILMVMGTIVTYGIIVIQFQQDKTQTVLYHFLNSSVREPMKPFELNM